MRFIHHAAVAAFALGCWVPDVQSAKDFYWKDCAVSLLGFEGKEINVVRSSAHGLYVATGHGLYLLDTTSGKISDQTIRIRKNEEDDVTDILFDDARQETWVATNGNTHSATCYKNLIVPDECKGSTFIKEWLAFVNLLQQSQPVPSSINAWAKDSSTAFVGFFKSNIYTYDIVSRKWALVYRTSSIYNSPTDVLVTKHLAVISTLGDGLLVFDRERGVVTRLKDIDVGRGYVRALTTDGKRVYLGTTGVYSLNLSDLEQLAAPNQPFQCQRAEAR